MLKSNVTTNFSQGALRKPAWELYQDIKRAKREVHVAARQYQDQYINTNMYRPLKVKELASHFNISESKLRTISMPNSIPA